MDNSEMNEMDLKKELKVKIEELENLSEELEYQHYDFNSRIAKLEKRLTEYNPGTDEYLQAQQELRELKRQQLELNYRQLKIMERLEELQEFYENPQLLQETDFSEAEQEVSDEIFADEEQNDESRENHSETKKSDKKSAKKHKSEKIRDIAKTPVKFAFNTVKDGAKTAVSKINPFDKEINKNDVSDSGAESIRLGYTTIKKGKNTIKTVNNTIKTTQRTVRTAGTVAKQAGKAIYRTADFTVKAIAATVKVTTNVVIHVVAALMNPIIIVLIILIVICLLSADALILIIAGSETDKSNKVNAAGLVEVPEQYQNGLTYFNTAVSNRKADFKSIIDNMYYDYNELPTSSVVYMKRTVPAPEIIYEESFSTDGQKGTLKSAWDMNLTITAKEAIAIAYVYLEKEKNEANHTEGGIYEVSYTQDVFDLILSKCVTYSHTVHSGQYCPSKNCTKHVEEVENPAHKEAYDKVNEAAENYNNTGSQYWADEYVHWSGVLDSTPETLEKVTYICNHEHDLHSIGLAFFQKEDIMNALGFTENDKQWEQLTEAGFENNPDISI